MVKGGKRASGFFKIRVCSVCGEQYLPTCPTQKYCPDCRAGADKKRDAESRKVRNADPKYREQRLADERARDAIRRSDPVFRARASEYLKRYNEDPDHQANARARRREWEHEHPLAHRLHVHKRRALKYGNTPIEELLTEAQWRDILDQYHHRCAYCGRKTEQLTVDHVIALSRGGKHSASNVVPACLHCNSTKGAKTTEEWVGLTSEVPIC